MTPRTISDIQQSVGTYEYDDEQVVVIDFGMVPEDELSVELLGDTLIVTYETENTSSQNIELTLPDEFIDPEVTVNNGIISITQAIGTNKSDETPAES